MRERAESLGRPEITPEMRRRFEHCAPAALKRRSSGYFRNLAAGCVQLPLLGAVGLAGLYIWQWSPVTLFAMLIAGSAASILVCTLRWLVAGRALRAQVERHNEDRFVWAMVEALREGRTHLNSGELVGYRAGIGIVLDWVLGTAALVLLAGVLLKMGRPAAAQLMTGGELPYAILFAVALPLLQGLFALWSWRRSHDAMLDDFGAGMHGALMLLFAAIFAFNADSAQTLHKWMVGLNVAAIVLGAMAWAGFRLMRQQTEWLRERLRAGNASPA